MSDEEFFSLRNIFESSIYGIEDLNEVHSYLLELSDDVLTQPLSNSEVSEIAHEVLRRLLGNEFFES